MLKKYIKENKRFCIFILAYIVITIVAYFLDNKFLMDSFCQSQVIVKTLLSSTMSILGIWISCYFLAIQIYKNRYPMDLIKGNLSTLFFKYITVLSICFVFGIIYCYVNISILSCIIYTLLCLACMFFILKRTFDTINDYSINTFFENRIKEINKTIENDDISTDELKENFKKISKLFDDAYNNGNYYICEKISLRLCDSFNNLVSNSGKILLNDLTDEKEEATEIVDFYLAFFKEKMLLAKDCNYAYLYIYLAKCQEDNLKATIDARQEVLFKKYLKSIVIFSYLIDESSDASSILFEMISVIAEYIADKIDDVNYEESLIELVSQITITKNYEYKNYSKGISAYYKLVLPLLRKVVENDNDKYYELLYDHILSCTRNFSVIDSSFDDAFIYFLSYSKLLLEKKDINKIKDYIKLYSLIEIPTSSDIKWVNYHFCYFDQLFDSFDDLKQISSKTIAVLIRDLITNKVSFQNIMLPKYHLDYYINLDGAKKFKDNTKWMYNIIRASIMNESLSVLSFYLEEINDSFISLDKTSKDNQKAIIDFYLTIINTTAEFSSKKVISAIFYEFDKTVREIDSKHMFSKEIAKYIISELRDISQFCMDRNDFIVLQCIETLYNFLEKDNEVHFANDIQDSIIKCIYNIGLHCIENNKESLLRMVSNSIGWITLNSIKNKNVLIYKYGLKRATDLYNLSKYMEITTKTKIFIMTLFTTIGSYCTTDPTLYPYRNEIIKTIIKEEYAIVQTATELRTKENSMWSSLMKDPQSAGKNFLKEFQKQQSAATKPKKKK